jgi:hypothetical protein
MYVECLLKIEGGIIAMIGASEEFIESADLKYQVTDYGVTVAIGDLELPLPWNIVESMIEEGQVVYLYTYSQDSFVGEHFATVALNRDQLLKSLGVWESRAASNS